MNRYDSETIFFIPGAFTQGASVLRTLAELCNDSKYVKENAKIGCFYGAPYCMWNGGHYIDIVEKLNDAQVLQYKSIAESFNIPIRFTFTNKYINTDELINDEYCNWLLDLFNNGRNEIILGTSELESYIRNKCGNGYKYISSTTTSQSEDVKRKELDEMDYSYVVLDMDHNKNFEYLDSLINKDKIELIVNSPCVDNCPFQAKHYECTSKQQLGLIESKDYPFMCPSRAGSVADRAQFKHFISTDDINNLYLPRDINHFKLEGRTAVLCYWAENVAYYLIKDEYQEEARDRIIDSAFAISIEVQ